LIFSFLTEVSVLDPCSKVW